MFNLSLQNPLDQAKPVENPSLPAAPSTIALSSEPDNATVAVENPQDFTAPIMNESASTPPIFSTPPPLEPTTPEPSLEEIAATLTTQAVDQAATLASNSQPQSGQMPQQEVATTPVATTTNSPQSQSELNPSTTPTIVTQPPIEQPAAVTDTITTNEQQPPVSSANPVQELARLMAEREIISQKQIEDVESLLTLQDLEKIFGRAGESVTPNTVSIVHNDQEIVVPIKDILKQLLGNSEKIIVNTSNQ